MTKFAIGTLNKEGWVEYHLADTMYCVSCKKTFPDVMETRRGQKILSIGQFLHNQHSILFGKKIKHTGNPRIFQVSCPFCHSINTINSTEIMETLNPIGINKYLRDNKGNMTIKEISKYLKLPKTQVAHFFRLDNSRVMPSSNVWLKLKQILKFDDTYDKKVINSQMSTFNQYTKDRKSLYNEVKKALSTAKFK